MIFLGYTSGMKGFKFMRKPNNVIFHGVTAMFDEHMFPSCPDNISPGSTHIGDNYPSTEFNIPPEDGGWFDGGALPPFGPYPSAGGIPLQQGPPIPGPQQPLAGPPNPPLCCRDLHKERRLSLPVPLNHLLNPQHLAAVRWNTILTQ